MRYTSQIEGLEPQIVDLFSASFAASAGAEEGVLIADLVTKLLGDTCAQDRYVFVALDQTGLTGGVIFSRLTYAEDPRSVFLLSPMAVAKARQGQGIGQALLQHALAALREIGVDVVITYGDPAFYGKVGFQPMTQTFATPPLPLSHPEGWIGQLLGQRPFTPLKGRSTCVSALNVPALW